MYKGAGAGFRKYKEIIYYLKAYSQKKQRLKFAHAVEQWNFGNSFSDLLALAALDHDYLERIGNRLVQQDRTNPKGYAVIQACCLHKPKPGHYDVEVTSQSVGIELIAKGKLKEARTIFLSLQKIFPESSEPYVLLYDLVYAMQEKYRVMPNPISHRNKKPLLLSFTVWGDKYIQLFNDYCIACMMAPGNLPAVAKIRDIYVDIYAPRVDIEKIKKQSMFNLFSKLCEINFVEFPERLVTCEGYKTNGAAFRYNIYGAFHTVSIERARTMGADVICLGPDNIYSDGSFFKYATFIDQGYDAVLFTSTRAQGEFLLPVLDRMRDPSTHVLAITSDEIVDFSTQYIHHDFLQYIVTDHMMPEWLSGFFIPHSHGLTIRSFHYHPVILSAGAINRSKNLKWNYTPLDGDLMTRLFPDTNDWNRIKVITDSRDGVMLDVAYGNPELQFHKPMEFNEKYVTKTSDRFGYNHFWNFQFTVNYCMEKEMNSVQGYVYENDGTLKPKKFPLISAMDDIAECLDRWYCAASKQVERPTTFMSVDA